LLLTLGVVACSDDDEPSAPDATGGGQSTGAATGATGGGQGGGDTELCQSIDELENAVGDVTDLDSSSTIDEAKEAKDGVSQALTAVKDAAGAVVAAVVSALETAFNAVSATIDDLQGDDTIGDAATDLANQSGVVEDAVNSVKSAVNCQ
jgi:hypothetical protein